MNWRKVKPDSSDAIFLAGIFWGWGFNQIVMHEYCAAAVQLAAAISLLILGRVVRRESAA